MRSRIATLRPFVTGFGLATLASTAACSMTDLVNNSQLPPDQRNPEAIRTPEGARSIYNGALTALATAVGAKGLSDSSASFASDNSPSYVYAVGLMTDEIEFLTPVGQVVNAFPTSWQGTLNSRTAPENDYSQIARNRAYGYTEVFRWLNQVRARSLEARGMLRAYAPESPQALVGHMFAVEGFADVLLAELFCSGITLSEFRFEADFVPSRGYTSAEVYQHAITLFDSALALSTDSTRIIRFAKLGRARALVGLGDYAAAAQEVADVPVNYQYTTSYTALRPNTFYTVTNFPWPGNVGNSLGMRGLPYSSDPRSASIALFSRQVPRKYLAPGDTTKNPGTQPIPIANGIEARLIEAEAQLRAGGSAWLVTLNQLRTTCATTAGCATPAPAGTGDVAGLPPLSDPGSDTARVSLLFRERAY